MTFISYAQNFEDVLLWRALKHVPRGFYIDVGANDPEEHSVTKAFYDAGWRGINIEPMPSYHQTFLEQRPRDINLAVACGAEQGSITLFDTPSVNGWASTDAATARAHRAEGVEVVEVEVPLRTLNDICAEYAEGDIHFLKIDVEGFEGEVLRGLDLRRWRPWLLAIEATLPNSRETVHEQWEHLVTPFGYRFAYFDGLNRYYVADEHAELLDVLNVQANVFDDFVTHHLDKAQARSAALAKEVSSNWQRVEQLAAQLEKMQGTLAEVQDQAEQATLGLHAAEGRIHTLQAALHESDEWGRNLEQRLIATYASTSWRITAPLRFIARRGPDSLPNMARRKAKGALRRSLRWVTSQEALRRTLLPLIDRSPWLQARVARALAAAKNATSDNVSGAQSVPQQLRELPESARVVLADLQQAYKEQAKL
jgi:FkbM family methyltransferase